jgi:Holliday junction resolvase-like predicted endonuclease
MWYGPTVVGASDLPGAKAITREHEERLRRAIRHVIRSSRSEDRRADVEHVFDLIAFLRPDVQAIVEHETACTLAELVGSL